MYGRFYNYIVQLRLNNGRERRNMKIINGRFEIVSDVQVSRIANDANKHEERWIIKPTEIPACGVVYDCVHCQYQDVFLTLAEILDKE
jgi:hypothetical protein